MAEKSRNNGNGKRRKLFAREFVKDFNATQAAIRAGYSVKTAKQQGSRLLTYDYVQTEIAKQAEKMVVRTELSQDRVIQEIVRIAFADVGNYTTWNEDGVRLVDSEELTSEQRAAVGEVAETKYGVKFKLCSKEKALEMLGRYFGMFTDKVEVYQHEVALEELE